MKKLLATILSLLIAFSINAAGKIQDADVKSEAELTAAGATAAALINDTKIYSSVLGEKLSTALTNGDIALGAGTTTDGFLANIGLSASVGSNALTIALKQKDGSTDPTTGAGAVQVAFRSSTVTSGSWSISSITSSLSITVPSGTTIGTRSAVESPIYVYLLYNSGSPVLALSLTYLNEKDVQSSSAISGGASASTLYSTSAVTSSPIRFIGTIVITETTAGTWATSPTNVNIQRASVLPTKVFCKVQNNAGTELTGTIMTVPFATIINDTHRGWSTSTNKYTIPITGLYRISFNGEATGSSSGASCLSYLYVDDSQYGHNTTWYTSPAASTDRSGHTTWTGYFTKGQTLQIKHTTNGTNTLISTTGYNELIIMSEFVQ